jgi:hypothetical protein
MARSWFRRLVNRESRKAPPAGGLARRATMRRAPLFQKRLEDWTLLDGSANAGQLLNPSSSSFAQAGDEKPIGTIDQNINNAKGSLSSLVRNLFNYAAGYVDLPLSFQFTSPAAEVPPASHASVASPGASTPRPGAHGPASGNLHRPSDLPQIARGVAVAPEDALPGGRRAVPPLIFALPSRGDQHNLPLIQAGWCPDFILTTVTTPQFRTGPEGLPTPERGRRVTGGRGRNRFHSVDSPRIPTRHQAPVPLAPCGDGLVPRALPWRGSRWPRPGEGSSPLISTREKP